MNAVNEIAISYSAVEAWRACPKRYDYQYFEKLRPQVEGTALVLGSILHTYAEVYYRSLQEGLKPKMAHARGLAEVDEQHGDSVRVMAEAAQASGVEGADAAIEELLDIIDKAKRIAERYYIARGKDDADHYEVLGVELKVRLELAHTLNGVIVMPGKVDLVMRDTTDGVLELWDHKSTKSAPGGGSRLRDLQTTIYGAALAEQFDLRPERLCWNYLITEEPKEPRELKDGSLSTALNQDTTDVLLAQEMKRRKFKKADREEYQELLDHLKGREKERFFPRKVIPAMTVESVLFDDVLITVEQITEARRMYELFGSAPTCVRVLTRQCDWCAFNDICTAVITGSDEEAVKSQQFRRARRGR